MRTKSKARSRTSQKRGQKTKYYFPQDFSKTRLACFKLRSGNLDLFNLRAPPFPFLGPTAVAASAGSDSLLSIRLCQKGGSSRSVAVRLRVQGEKEMTDRLVAHHPITASPPKSFSSRLSVLRGMQKEREAVSSDFHLALRLFSPFVPYPGPCTFVCPTIQIIIRNPSVHANCPAQNGFGTSVSSSRRPTSCPVR